MRSSILLSLLITFTPLSSFSMKETSNAQTSQVTQSSTTQASLSDKTKDFGVSTLSTTVNVIATPIIVGTGMKLTEYTVNQLVNIFSWLKNSVICYNYTPEEAKPELLTIVTAYKEGSSDIVDIATTKHLIHLLNSLYGRHKLLAGDPLIEQHAKILQDLVPDYAKFLLCIKRYHAYRDLTSGFTEDKEFHPDFGICKPPYAIEKYLMYYPERKRLAEFIKNLSAQENSK